MSKQEDKVLAIGSGSFLHTLIEAWYDAGYPAITVYEAEKIFEEPYNAKQQPEPNWRSLIRPYQFILYVAQLDHLQELSDIQDACVVEGKQLVPAAIYRGAGLIGPLLQPGEEVRPEAAWRSLHPTVFLENTQVHNISNRALAFLANLIIHEWHLEATEGEEPACRDQCYIFNPATLTGSWHSIRQHFFELAQRIKPASRIPDLKQVIAANDALADKKSTNGWYTSFERLTSSINGVFHAWEEADLIQLPLAQCSVQPVDPLSEDDAILLTKIVCSGLTHEEARRESGLAGLEAITERLLPLQFPTLSSDQRANVGIGAGTHASEAVGRGLRAVLMKQFEKRIEQSRVHSNPITVTRVEHVQIEDARCQYDMQALSLLRGEPLIFVSEPLLGCPVMWVYSDNVWYGGTDAEITLALRHTLQMALNKKEGLASDLFLVQSEDRKWGHSLVIPSIPYPTPLEHWNSMIRHVLLQADACIEVYDLHCSSFLGSEPFFIYGAVRREEESS